MPAIKLPEPTKSYYKVIVTHGWNTMYIPERGWCGQTVRSGNAFVWTNSYSRDLSAYLKMYAEALKDFPSLPLDSCECTSVVKSSWAKEFAVLRFSVPADTVMEGWENRDRLHDMILG